MPSFVPVYTGNNVLTGPAQIWYQPWSASTPAALPADTSPLGFSWATPWKAIGATTQGVTVDFNRQVQEINIEEQVLPVDQKTTQAHFNFTAILSEDTLETMALAYGGGTVSTVAAATGTPGTQTLLLTDELTYIAIGLESFARPRTTGVTGNDVPWRRVLVSKVSSAAQVQTPYRRSASQRVYPVTFTSLVALSSIIIKEFNASAL